MDVSFIIPARNEGIALHATLNHLAQLCPNLTKEIVLIDDASDEPVTIGMNLPIQLTVHRCDRRVGVARARNLGASLSSGEVLIFMDAHVCFALGAINELLKTGVKSHSIIAGCATCLHYDLDRFVAVSQGEIVGRSEQTYFGWMLDPADPLRIHANRKRKSPQPFEVPYVGCASLAISRKLFEALGRFERELGGYGNLEDFELAMRCWSFGKQVLVVPSAICHHFTEPGKLRLKNTAPTGDHPLEHFQYDGTTKNALRVMYLHYPCDVTRLALGRCFPEGANVDPVDGMPFDIVSNRLAKRARWIESRRKFDRDWLMRRLTTL